MREEKLCCDGRDLMRIVYIYCFFDFVLWGFWETRLFKTFAEKQNNAFNFYIYF